MKSRDWERVSRRSPCRICKAITRCGYTLDGRVAKCCYALDGGHAGSDDVGDFALYFNDSIPGAVRKSFEPPPAAPIADVDTRHQVYSALLQSLTLWPEHRDALLCRGLSDADIDAAGYRSLPSALQERAGVVAAVRASLGGDVPVDVPGLHAGQLPAHAAGLLIPVRDAAGLITALKVRRDGKADPRYLWLSSKSAGGASSGSLAHAPVSAREMLGTLSSRVIRITEGPLKADVATALSGVPTIAVPGAMAARTALPLLRVLAPRVVLLSWDSDARTNPHVAGGVESAMHLLTSELPGVDVHVETWATDKSSQPKGIDDALAAGVALIVHQGPDAWRELVAILRAAGREPRPETLSRAGMEGEDDVEPGPAAAPQVATPTRITDWQSLLLVDGRGVARKSFANACALLEHSPEWSGRLAWNAKRQVILLDGHTIADADVDAARVALERSWGFDPGSQNMWAAMRVAGNARVVNPVADYLTALVWDGQKRLDTIARRFLGASAPLSARMLRMWMIAAVARALNPGCQVDTVLVLIGNQGMKKSSLLRGLAGDEWFSDSHVDLASKDAFLQFGHAWIIEWGEFERIMQRHDAAFTKTLIPSRVDTFRPPYGHGIVSVPRSCLFVGTTNKRQFLNDETGDRRYWCVEVTRAIDLEAIAAERSQLWAEAVHAYQSGEAWWFDVEDEAARALAAEIHSVQDPWEPAITAWIEKQERRDFTTAEIFTEVLAIPLRDQKSDVSGRLGRVMRRLGYLQKTVRPLRQGQRLAPTRCWVPERVVEARRVAAEDGRVPGHGDAYDGPDAGDEQRGVAGFEWQGEGFSDVV